MINNFQDLVELASITSFEQVSVGGAATTVFANDVPESSQRYIFGLYVSDTSGAANTLTINKVEEDDTKSTIVNSYAVGASESFFLSPGDMSLVLPSLEGGTNLELNSSGGLEVTVLWFPDELV